jgi:hypothetical protein
MITFSDRGKLKAYSGKLKEMLMVLESSIPTLNKMEVGLNFSTRPVAHDVVLIADFDNENGLNIYREHPEHIKVLDFLKGKVEKSAVVDYYI